MRPRSVYKRLNIESGLLLLQPLSYPYPPPLMPSQNRVKHVCFTHNNPVREDEERYRDLVPSLANYVVFGRETGDSGTPHLQGFIKWDLAKTYREIHRLCPGAHVEGARSPVAAIKYCKKDGDFEEYGTCPRGTTGANRPSFGEVGQYVREHGIAKARTKYWDFWCRSGRTLMQNVRMPGIDRLDIECVWICGYPGVGKSYLAHQIYPNAYRKNPRTKWWHGYEYEGTCIMDDFAPEGIDLTYLLRWIDKYPCRIETKGGEMELYVRKFIITSNFVPEQVYPNHPQLSALKRRIQVAHMNGNRTLTWRTN